MKKLNGEMMSFFQNVNIKIWSGLLIGLGMVGTVFFFPVNFQSRYTCLYHRLIHPNRCVPQQDPSCDRSKNEEDNQVHSLQNREPAQAGFGAEEKGKTPETGVQEKAPRGFFQDHEANASLVRHYVNHFAFFWWGSIVLIGLGYYAWRLSRSKGNKISG